MNDKTRRLAPRVGVALAAAAMALVACAPEQPYFAPTFGFKNSYASAKGGSPVLLSNTEWWRGFKDPTLNALIDRAMRENIDLAIARERVNEALAQVDSIPAEASLTPDLEAKRTKAYGGSPRTRTAAGLEFSWLLDPYGARREQVKASKALVEVADAEVAAARLLLLQNLCNAVIDLRYRQQLLTVRQEEVRARRQTLNLTRTLVDQGSGTRLDLVQTEARLAETEAVIPMLRAAIGQEKYRIATLLGMAPGSLPVDLDRSTRQLRPAITPNVGIPSDLMRNRPDIRIAERLYYASLSDLAVARASLYPQLSLTGSISLVSLSGNGSGSEYVFGPSIVLPALPDSPRRAAVSVRESRVRQANASWKGAVLDALYDVESALLGYSASTEAVSRSQRTVNLYDETVSLTRDLVSKDGATIPALLEAQENSADAKLILAENMRQKARSYVALNVSLGSGNADALPEDSAPVIASAATQ